LDDPFSSTPIATPLTTTHYTVLAWEGSCPPDSHQVTVVVNDKPNVNAGVDQTIIAGNAAMLFGTGSNITSYLWGPEESLNCTTCSNPIATPNETTSYILTGISSNGCRKSDTVTVFVICDNSQVFIPNTFSPNGDGQNEVFYPRGKGIKEIKSFRIYNRWGELVFEKRNIPLNDEANGWDGRYNGSEASSDVYVYVIDAICDNGSALSWKGDISLLR
jgi:gliding motility-associated-like protein